MYMVSWLTFLTHFFMKFGKMMKFFRSIRTENVFFFIFQEQGSSSRSSKSDYVEVMQILVLEYLEFLCLFLTLC